MVPVVPGRVRVTLAFPELSTVAICLLAFPYVPPERVPASTVNSTEAPAANAGPHGGLPQAGEPTEFPGLRFIDSVTCVPAVPELGLLLINVAAGFPTISQPPFVCVAVPSVPVTV